MMLNQPNTGKFSIVIALIFCLIVNLNGYAQGFYQEKQPRNETLALGIGPSFIYADNGGQYSIYNFKWNPVFSLIYEKRLADHFSFRATSGIQWIESGGNPTPSLVDRWLEKEQAVSFNGVSYYVDFMPMINLAPVFHHMVRPDFNLYLGIGFGALYAVTQQTFSLEPTAVSRRATVLTPTLTFRSGISYTLNEYWDLALEGSMIFTFSDKIDGNNVTQNRNDHLMQAQLVIRKYLSPR
ncbi:hypothetical protein [Cecembia lonarensis]|uniref:Outer membrane protein beta-barrel domain-containing protein n=1 Tax=Cecembia lonarensis (strain CCUG 58316 / KCTC 22772 / LW9) TaxID=1225176 RepID=K1LJY2_CECL9|nr:hypothetical protein [Cecembia lonarensis]EKB50638.1 hypothetical protein B879_00616 [Cecembia lonarensis LW9]